MSTYDSKGVSKSRNNDYVQTVPGQGDPLTTVLLACEYMRMDGTRWSPPAIGRALKAARESNGFTQSEVVGHLGLAQSTLSRFERGKASPSTAQLRHLADLYGVSVEDLYGITTFADGDGTLRVWPHEELKGKVEQAMSQADEDDLATLHWVLDRILDKARAHRLQDGARPVALRSVTGSKTNRKD